MKQHHVFSFLQRMGKSFMLPIAVLPVAGIFLGVGSSLTNETTIAALHLELVLGQGTFLYSVLILLKQVGKVLFDNLPLIFAVSIALGMSKRRKEVAALAAIIAFFVMHATINTLLCLDGSIVNGVVSNYILDGSITSVCGMLSLEMGVFGGIVVGLGVSYLHNHFYQIQLPNVISFYEGERFVPIICAITYVFIGVLMYFIWPPLQHGVYNLGQFISDSGYFGTFIYGIIKRSFRGKSQSLGWRSSTLRAYFIVSNRFRHHARKGKNCRDLTWCHVDSFCWNRFRAFQFKPKRTLHFLKEFGLILFVYSIGLQVGPGFFSAFKKGGFTLNILAVTSVSLSVAVAIVLYLVTDTPITTIVGILSGAVTNTPGLGAAQQANSDLNGIDAPEIAMGYAVAYPLGVIGAILALQSLKYILKINTTTEEAEAEKGMGHLQELTVRPVSLEIINKAIDNKTIKDIHPLVNRKFVISRIRDQHGKQELVNSDTELHLGDQILVISTPKDIEAITVFFGKQIDVKWEDEDSNLVSRRILITKPELNGKTLSQLRIRRNFGASITRVNRSGVDLVAAPNLQLQMGDRVTVVGSELAVSHAENTR